MLKSFSVTKYAPTSATLTLEHNYPVGSLLKARVDISLVLEKTQSTDLRIGEWVNIIGYVTKDPDDIRPKPKGPFRSVQAIVLWSATCVVVKDYEEVLEKRLEGTKE